MDFESIEDIEQQGFSRFVAVSVLRESACRQVPEVPGVYLVIRPQPQPPIFLGHSTGGHFKGQEPLCPNPGIAAGMGHRIDRHLYRQGHRAPEAPAQLHAFRLRRACAPLGWALHLAACRCGKPVGVPEGNAR